MDAVLFSELFAMGIIFFFGVIFNIVVIRSIYLTLAKRSTTTYSNQNDCVHLLVLNLAIADLVMLLISIPTDVIPEHISWPFGLFVCKFISPIQDICLTASALTFGAIAVQRYLVSRGFYNKDTRSTKWTILAIWLVSWLTMGLPMSIYKKLVDDNNFLKCDIQWPSKTVERFFVFYMVALLTGCALTGAIAYCGVRRNLSKVHRIYIQERSIESIDKISEDSLAEQALKLSNMICVLITVFVVCVFPFPLFVVLMQFGVLTHYKYSYVIYLGATCMLYGNSVANPLILMFMSKEGRTALPGRRVSPRRNVAKTTDAMMLADV